MTIICRSRSFVFVHLLKCGGTSVEKAFAPHARWNDVILGSTFWGERLNPIYQRLYGLEKHSWAHQIRKSVGAETWSRYWTVSLVRHPLRIVESTYSWIGEIVDRYMARHGLDPDRFAKLLRDNQLRADFAPWHATRAYAGSNCFADFVQAAIDQRALLTTTMTRRLSQGRNMTMIVDDVFKLEEIERLWDAFDARLGLKLERLHANASTPRQYQWDSRHIQEMHRLFEPDFVNFNYE
jgi:hypothetical protein